MVQAPLSGGTSSPHEVPIVLTRLARGHGRRAGGNIMIACYLWRSVGIAEWSLRRPLAETEIKAVSDLLRRYDLDARVHRSESQFIYWYFQNAGTDERTRLKLQVEITKTLIHLAKEKVMETPDLTLHWDGARTRIDEA